MANALIKGAGFGGVDCDAATATEKYVLTGKTFGKANSDELATGSMPNKGTTNYTISTNGGNVTIAEGKHSGSGKVTYSLPQFGGPVSWRGKTAQQTIETSGKYIPSNIEVQAEPNLKAANIVAGKTIWGVAGSFVDMENTLTLYQNGQYGGWWKDGLVKNIHYTNYDYLRCDSKQGATPTTATAKPNPLVVFLDESTSGNFYIDYGWCGLKSIDLSFYKTITINFTLSSASGAYQPAVQPRVWILSTANKQREDYESGTNHKINQGNGDDGTYTDTINIEEYTGHHYIAIVFDFNVQIHIAGSTSSHGWSYRKVTVNYITLGK